MGMKRYLAVVNGQDFETELSQSSDNVLESQLQETGHGILPVPFPPSGLFSFLNLLLLGEKPKGMGMERRLLVE